MAEYLVLRDAFRAGPGDDPFVPGMVWVRGRAGASSAEDMWITVYAGLQFSEQLGSAQRQLAEARGDGFSEDSIWEYLAEHGGNGYTMLRAGPTEESGPSALAVGLEELRLL